MSVTLLATVRVAVPRILGTVLPNINS
jgi:hypothetical protein